MGSYRERVGLREDGSAVAEAVTALSGRIWGNKGEWGFYEALLVSFYKVPMHDDKPDGMGPPGGAGQVFLPVGGSAHSA